MSSLAGINVTEIINIESPEHLSDVLGAASESGTPVIPVGGGTCLSTGHPVEHDFLALDLSGVSGTVDYIPTDMTAGFMVGTSMQEVRETLAANGQELPIDLAEDDAGTIGGLVATGLSGPRRYGQGTLKDLIIGCEYVRGDGLIAKAGGMTVKNVSGFEISRMLHGSWGSLAVITRINLKVIPGPRADRTLVWQDSTAELALARQHRLLAAFPNCVALQSLQQGDCWETAIRFIGREPSVVDYTRQAVEAMGGSSKGDVSPDFWVAKPSAAENAQLVLSASVDSLTGLTASLVSTPGVSEMSVSLGTGTIRAQLDQNRVASEHLNHLGSSLWMIEGGNDSWKTGKSVWGPARADASVARSIKQQFDPANILNRDRLFI